jgi:hypothetical protein
METQANLTPATYAAPDTLKANIIEALRVFIRSRPGLDYANYGDAQTYRAELREITRDLKEAQTLLDTVERSHGLTGKNLIDAASLAFSGRLKIETVREWECGCGNKYTAPVKMADTANLSGEGVAWCPKCKARPVMGSPHKIRIHYTTGQYYPTEYRRAVASVAASALWDYVREHSMPAPAYFVEWQNERGEYVRVNNHLIRDPKEAEALADSVRKQKEKERAAFATPPHGYGYTTIREAYKTSTGYISGGDWLRAYFRREFGRGIASRFFH